MRKVFVLIILIAFAGCVPPAPKVVIGPEADFQHAALSVKEKKFHEAIAAYRKIAADAPQSPVAADALFEASYLQTFYDNPQKDYAQALQGFEDFLKHYPGHVKAPDARNWRVVLKTILDARKENDRLNQSIEELKKLDIRHEERRRK